MFNQEFKVLIIEVTNAREVLRREIGKLGERFIGKVSDAEAQVEKTLINEMENAFQESGIEARIISVKGPRLDGGHCLEFPLHIREEREVTLNDD